MELVQIASFRSPFSSKFGIPKQSSLVEQLEGKVVFEPDYRNQDLIRGLDGFDYIWLLWGFSANRHSAVSPVVRPPVLGGNEKVGVFATRSPFRPNPIGLSSVRIVDIERGGKDGPTIKVAGADLMDGTPIYDIKPYVGYADCHENVRSGFVDKRSWPKLKVDMPKDVVSALTDGQQQVLRQVLELDPRPHYQNNPEKVYGMSFYGYDVHFKVSQTGVLTVLSLSPLL